MEDSIYVVRGAGTEVHYHGNELEQAILTAANLALELGEEIKVFKVTERLLYRIEHGSQASSR